MKTNLYALVEDNVVVNTIVAPYKFILRQPGRWVEISKDNKASKGFLLIGENFVRPKPYKDWVLEGTRWKAPKAEPGLQADEVAEWDDKKGDWTKFKRNEKAITADSDHINAEKK